MEQYTGFFKTLKRNKEDKKFCIEFMKNECNIDILPTKMWSAELGEKLVKFLLEKNGVEVFKARKINHFKPDFECKDFVYEVKTRNYTVGGTAGEKILGVPFKYRNIPILYKKPLKIILVGYQEQEGIEKFKLFNPDERGRKMLDFWEEMGITFHKCSELL